MDGTADALANRRVSEEWKAWGKRGNCTVDAELSWREVEDLAAVSWQRDGEVILRLVQNWKRNRWNFAVEPIEADRLDIDFSTLLRNGNEIKMGVELEARTRRIVAYWILTAHPGEFSMANASKRHQRIPAKQIIHLFTRDRIGQNRGTPRLEASMARLHMLGGYEEAEVVAARAGSSKFATITTESGAEYTGDGEGEEESGGDSEVVISDFGQGTIEQLADGQSLTMHDPTHPTTQYADAVKSFLRGAASGMGASYNSLANDLEGVNYSSLRHGTQEERDQWRREQQHFHSRVSSEVYAAWLEAAIMSDAIAPLSILGIERYANVSWIGKRWEYIDPLKESKGNAQAIPHYGKTLTEIAQARGRTIEDVIAEVAEERDLLEKQGLPHPIDHVGKDPESPPSGEDLSEGKED